MLDNRCPEAEYSFDMLEIQADLRPEWVLENLKKAGFPENDRTRRMIEEAAPLAQRLARPQVVARLYPKRALTPSDVESLPDPIRQALYLLFAVATAGRPLDEEAARLRTEGELIESMVIDAHALTALYQATARLMGNVRHWAQERNLGSSRAFSPGSGRNAWTLPHQALLFAHVPASLIDVELTPSFLMRPTKSISFVLGMGENITDIKDPFSCAGCPRLDCSYRHEAADEMIPSS